MPVHNAGELTIPRTTDSLAFDILGLRVGESYSEQSMFDSLKLRLDDLKYLSEMKEKDWSNDVTYFHNVETGNPVYYVKRNTSLIPEFENIRLNEAFFHMTPDGFLYEISVLSDFKEYDVDSANYLFRSITAELAGSLGEPVYTRPQMHDSKHLSFKTGKIEKMHGEDNLTFQTSSWSDGTRQMEFGYISTVPNSCSFSLKLKDEALSRMMESNDETAKASDTESER
jgi:hypothetical protein